MSDGKPKPIKTELSRKTALAYVRAWRAKGQNVYSRKVKGGTYTVFEK